MAITDTPTDAGALHGLRVLDLSGPSANFAAKLIADMGADVIKVEPPEGDPLRHRGPQTPFGPVGLDPGEVR